MGEVRGRMDEEMQQQEDDEMGGERWVDAGEKMVGFFFFFCRFLPVAPSREWLLAAGKKVLYNDNWCIWHLLPQFAKWWVRKER